MDLFDNVPVESVIANLRPQAEAEKGVRGGLIGAGLGLATALAAMKAAGRKPSIPMLLTGVAIGIAYGAADTKAIRGE